MIAAVFSALLPAIAAAQSIQLLSPTSQVNIPEGDDYAKTVLNNAWDMNERRDIGYEENFNGPSISSNGIWFGVNATTGGYLFPLFGGFKGSLQAEGLDGARQTPRFGSNHPVDSSRYSVLSYRLRASARGTYAIYWSSAAGPTYFPDGSQYGANLDGVYLDRAYYNAGWMNYTFDLRTPGFESSRGAWSGAVHALRLDPSIGAGPGASTEIDWIRLVDPNSAPRVRLRWQSSGLPGGTVITVWLDDNAGGYDGTVFARYVADGQGRFLPLGREYSTSATLYSDAGFHEFPGAVLPPGAHYFYVTANRLSNGTVQEIARSGYSAAVSVNSAPQAFFVSPTETSGVDYAQQNLGNPWDMSDGIDVANLPGSGTPAPLIQYSNPAFVNGVFQATANPPLPGNAQSDAQVHLRVSGTAPIPTSRYRYLTYRIAVDETAYPTIHDKVAHGWVARPVFWNSGLLTDGGSTQAHILYEGWHTYTIDLWAPGIMEHGIPWRSVPLVRMLRLDPVETTIPTWFFIDSVNLTADNAPVNSHFDVRFILEDNDNSTLNVSLYADADRSGFNGVLIGSLGSVGTGIRSFGWNTSSLGAGHYYPYIVMSDGSNTRRWYAPVPVAVGSAPPEAPKGKVPYDYDGDQTSDPVVLRPARAARFYVRASSGASYTRDIGSLSSLAVQGDFNGDWIADLTTLEISKGALLWTSIMSTTGAVESRYWGLPGDIPAVADYDGDGADEFTVYRNGAWFMLNRNGAVRTAAWGEPGDIPVPGDYDADGLTDITIWRPRDGMWWIAYGRGGYRVEQWGLPGDIPIPADYDGDKLTDFAVWRPSNGTWYVKSARTGSTEVAQWGLPGDVPVAGDFGGDGKIDFTVWRPGNGIWYINDRKGSLLASQWGLPSDRVPD